MKISKLAAIDIGSNAMRLLINTIYDDGKNVIFNKTSLVRVPVRLGEDAFLSNTISIENEKRLLDSMKAFKLLMDVYQVQAYSAFATSAMREIAQNEAIVAKVKEKADVNLEVIDGKKEGQIVFATELKEYVHDENNYLYIDVGGGSTELTLLANGKVVTTKSFPIGTVRWLNGKVGESFLKDKIRPWVKKQCKGIENIEFIGSGGNINHIFKQSDKKKGKPLTYSYMSNQLKILKSLSLEQRIMELNMKLDRADVIVPALEIYTNVMKYAKAKKIHVPKIGLADGMIQYQYHNEFKNK